MQIALRAMEEPLRQIVSNAGGEASVVVQAVRDKEGAWDYNAQTEEYGDMLEMGIIDPAKVIRSALQNAASIAGLMLTTAAMVAEESKEEKLPAAPGMDAGMDF